jgi:hypothetical protein
MCAVFDEGFARLAADEIEQRMRDETFRAPGRQRGRQAFAKR